MALAGGGLARRVPAFARPVASDGGGRSVDCLYRRINHAQLGAAMLVGVPLSWLADATGPVVIDPTYLGESADGYINGSNATYATARSTSAASDDTATTAIVGQRWTGAVYVVFRAFTSFDTSAIGSDVVSAASLYVKAATDTSTTDFNVQLYRYAWADTLASSREANYDGAYGGSATLEGTLQNTATAWTSGTYYGRSVDVAGVNTSGDSRYTLVSSRDVGNNTPTGSEFVSFYATEQSGTGDDPYMDITHAPAATGQPTPIRSWGIPHARPAGFGGVRIGG